MGEEIGGDREHGEAADRRAASVAYGVTAAPRTRAGDDQADNLAEHLARVMGANAEETAWPDECERGPLPSAGSAHDRVPDSAIRRWHPLTLARFGPQRTRPAMLVATLHGCQPMCGVDRGSTSPTPYHASPWSKRWLYSSAVIRSFSASAIPWNRAGRKGCNASIFFQPGSGASPFVSGTYFETALFVCRVT